MVSHIPKVILHRGEEKRTVSTSEDGGEEEELGSNSEDAGGEEEDRELAETAVLDHATQQVVVVEESLLPSVVGAGQLYRGLDGRRRRIDGCMVKGCLDTRHTGAH